MTQLAIVAEDSRNNKIAGSHRVAASYAPTKLTCPKSCPLMDDGCYATMGRTAIHANRLNQAVKKGMRPEQGARAEAKAIKATFKGGQIPQDGKKGGRDFRLHVAGDVRTKKSAEILAGAARAWKKRGGGDMWTYTHSWRTIPRHHFGKISVLASIEKPADAEEARKQGFAPALVVQTHPSTKAFKVEGTDTEFIPCPQQTRGVACSDCRLCFSESKLFHQGKGIAFAAHGATQKIKKHLTVV